MIGRREALDVEGDGGILKARVVVLQGFQLPEVGRGNGQTRPIRQLLQQGDGQRRPLGGIGAGTHLIEKHQLSSGLGRQIATGGRQGLQDSRNPAHMATEGREVLLEGLLIANVRENLLTPGQTRRPFAGHKQARPGHEDRQANAFKGHRFAARVRAGDRHHPQAALHADAHGNDRSASLATFLPEQERMPQPLQLKRRQGIGLQLGAHSSQPSAVSGAGQGEIQLNQDLLQVLERRLLFSHQGAELLEHRPLRLALLAFQLPDPVAQGDHRLGLDKDGVAGGGAVVNQARQLTAGARLHRQDRPAIALGDHRVLKERGVTTNQLIQTITAFHPHGSELTTQAREGRAGAIRHTPPVLNAKAQALLQLRQGA